jgi:hypothetical protein
MGKHYLGIAQRAYRPWVLPAQWQLHCQGNSYECYVAQLISGHSSVFVWWKTHILCSTLCKLSASLAG